MTGWTWRGKGEERSPEKCVIRTSSLKTGVPLTTASPDVCVEMQAPGPHPRTPEADRPWGPALLISASVPGAEVEEDPGTSGFNPVSGEEVPHNSR